MEIALGTQFHKIMGMAEQKRQRVLNAAMEEFTAGYKAASTDAIAKRAGISKGLLFHYFGTKRELHIFLIEYALETITQEYFDIINMKQGDLLERIWQMCLLKRDLCRKYPGIFDFLTSAFYRMCDDPGNDFGVRFARLQRDIYDALYSQVDERLFKDGVDKMMASNVIRWALEGLTDQLTAERRSFAEMNAEFDAFLAETRRYLDFLRAVLYR